ncbi:Plasmid stabilization system protein [uncultured Pleomorphomonas sp.]|uniref:Plasmid stabilization protein n=2 Tax=Pleomorphomonas TaxID=261933 RepID=A0A2G9X2C0_9HYPH|nr:type II toxin-antitoxin system RelE/ParE family toxin [Pleomorphomonas carboxyditropha]PIP01112.1 plasmid stabilization protein [Pleomorphomonas carboxyditropha]SCM74766.1 Plasmid stabilization system protein [uncultured Pleomorphomonas sp.]
MAEVVYSRQARADMLDVWLWIAETSGATMADTLIERIERRVSMLANHPEMGPVRPEIAEAARVLVSERWLVLYCIDEMLVRIVRVVDGARDLRQIEWSTSGKPAARS